MCATITVFILPDMLKRVLGVVELSVCVKLGTELNHTFVVSGLACLFTCLCIGLFCILYCSLFKNLEYRAYPIKPVAFVLVY
jgi:hypothetical protein